MEDSLINIFIDIGQNIIIPIITALTGLFGVYYGAHLTEKNRKEEHLQVNINKLKFLLEYTEKYLMCLLQYREDFIDKKVKAINKIPELCDYITKSSPYAPISFSIKLKDYSFLMNANYSLLSILNMLLYYSFSLENLIEKHDNYIEKISIMQLEGKSNHIDKNSLIVMMSSMVSSIDITHKNVVFFSNLLYKNIINLLTKKYKLTVSCQEKIYKRDLMKDAEHNADLNIWIDYINKSWNN